MTFQKGNKSRTNMPHTNITKEKISKSLLGHIVSEETRKKQSLKKIGKIPWNKGKKLPSSWIKGKTHTEETKQKLRIARARQISSGMKGKHLTEETKQKLRIARARKVFKNKKYIGLFTPSAYVKYLSKHPYTWCIAESKSHNILTKNKKVKIYKVTKR